MFFFQPECPSIGLTGDTRKGEIEITGDVGDELFIFVNLFSCLRKEFSARHAAWRGVWDE
jgi:hypothetical protein